MRAGMISERQLQHVLEVLRQHHIAAMMGEPVGKPSHQGAGDDDEEPEADPGPDQRCQYPRCGAEAFGQGTGKRIDNAAEQHRLDELRAGERDVGEPQRYRELGLRAQQSQHAKIDAEEGHTKF